ncbi:hypothetical protein Pyn_23496 [Prunus yedoensis var. nudiflora]|uniref:Uncharacterized protein n=1 Tax=Prunus yedoensis var. nudiflora TaxID=2094558 RepID=A0A314Z9M4_PRUYE|nr:hypothetical protein Pyn_26180 [Prunus yedoensis var. nudiflora]PQQ18402.1 hypothetical protein Pyn_23496 [Prunus yedoensis var. nudiflora]
MEIIPLVGDMRYESFLDKSKQDIASSSRLVLGRSLVISSSHSLVSIYQGEPWELPAFNQHHQNQMTNCHFGFNSKGKRGEI